MATRVIKSLRSLTSLKGVPVLVRIDANVPVEKGAVIDDSRLKAVLPTLMYLQKKEAITIIVSHLGRPGGMVREECSLKPVAERLEALVQKPIQFVPTAWSLDRENKKQLSQVLGEGRPGSIFFCENIRFSSLEEKKSRLLASFLASLADVYINDGFAVAHRADTSVALVPEYLPSYAGFLLTKEMQGLNALKQKKKRPYVALLGGIKLETKIPLITSLQKKSDALLLGGGIANTCLAALGYGVGDSLVDTTLFSVAKRIAMHRKTVLPLDVVVGMKDGSGVRVVKVSEHPVALAEKGEAIFDIGPKTIATYRALLREAKKVIWNGAMGYFEKEEYAKGTLRLARAFGTKKRSGVYVVAGGGETIEAITQAKAKRGFSLCSTGGGAMLSYIAGEALPGVEALRQKKKEKRKK